MSINFYLSPFTYATWQGFEYSGTMPIGDLVINPSDYKDGLMMRWPQVEFDEEVIGGTVLPFPLRWTLPTPRPDHSGLQGKLYPNLQVVSFGLAFRETFLPFILWHRSFIAAKYRLYLFNDSSPDFLTIEQTTTEQEIIDFTGIGDD
jgi:hypothetical protein